MAGRLRVRVVTPRRELLDREADEVRLPGVLGEMGVLHADRGRSATAS